MEGVCFQSGPLKMLLDGLDEALHPYSAGVHYRVSESGLVSTLGRPFLRRVEGRQVQRRAKLQDCSFYKLYR